MDILLFSASTLAAAYWKRRNKNSFEPQTAQEVALKRALQDGTSLNAKELICTVTADNQELVGGGLRKDMRLKNLWHRATYILVVHDQEGKVCLQDQNVLPRKLDETFVLVQRRSAIKDYCPLKLDPLPGGVVEYGESYRENAVREMQEEMGIDLSNNDNNNTITRLFTFPYEDNRVRVWGDCYECIYRGSIDALIMQEEEVDSITRMSLQELKDRIDNNPGDFMPDACYCMQLYFQRMGDLQVNRRLLRGMSSLDSYKLHPRPKVVFFDCDDCLYFDGWKTARQLTERIDEYCTKRVGLEKGYAYQLYKKYGTALRGLLAEGLIENTPEAIDDFLQEVHNVPVHELIQPDENLREILLRVDPTIPKYIFTASVREHAMRCLQALGIADLFVDIIDCKTCDLETKHSRRSFETAMRVAGVDDPEHCLFLDDNLTNIQAARDIGWRSVLVGRVGRDCGEAISSEHAELEIDRIHHVQDVLPEIFGPSESM